jgi:hypothetical protein
MRFAALRAETKRFASLSAEMAAAPPEMGNGK